MPANALIQTRIDPKIKKRAAAVLANVGLSVSDAVRIVLTRTASEGEIPFSLTDTAAEHDAWFRSRVQEALNDCTPAVTHHAVEAHFAKRRTAATQSIEGQGLRLEWSVFAQQDRDPIFDNIEANNPRAAAPNDQRIAARKIGPVS